MTNIAIHKDKPDIFIIGAGGIGGNLMYNLVRDRISMLERIGTIHIFDGDVVEEKNLLRQNFAADAVGENKAIAMENQYSELMDIEAYPRYFMPKETDSRPSDIELIDAGDIIISCVDNIQTRLEILTEFIKIIDTHGIDTLPLLIDAGNETYNGSVVLLSDEEILHRYIQSLSSRSKAKDAPYSKNCADYTPEEEGFPQIYSVNMFAALYVSVLLEKITDINFNEESFRMITPYGIMFNQLTTTLLNPANHMPIVTQVEVAHDKG